MKKKQRLSENTESESIDDVQEEPQSENNITKTYLYSFEPLKPHFYIVKLRFKGVYIIFSYFSSKTYIAGTRKNRLNEAVLTGTHNICFEQKYEKYQFYLYVNRSVFIMKPTNDTERVKIFSPTFKNGYIKKFSEL